MESEEARQALDSVDRERAESGRRYTVPTGYDELLGLAVALIAVGVALSNTWDGWRGTAAVLTTVAVALTLLGTQVRRFRRLNGAWVSGLIAGPTRVVTVAALLLEVLGIVTASELAVNGHVGWAVAVAAATGAVFAGFSRAWSRRYRAELGT